MELERQTLQPIPHYYLLSAPARKGRSRLPFLIALHGYAGDMTSMMRVARKIAKEKMIVSCPQGPHQFWVPSVDAVASRKVGFGWLTSYRSEDSQERHHQLIQLLIEEAYQGFGADRNRVFLMGFSQACALNYRFAFTHPGALRGVIGICGGLPGDFQEPKYEPIPAAVLHVAATHDQYYSTKRTRSFDAALRRLSGDVTYREFASKHMIPRRSLPFIRKWILEHC